MRKTMEFVKERFGDQVLVGAEVGVSNGHHAKDILLNMPNVKLLYLIDPYMEGSIWAVHKDPAKQRIAEATKASGGKQLSPFTNRTQWIYKPFEECTREDIPEPLDFVYIDGNHAYEHVSKDLALAAQLVKKGGVIGGHDAGSLGIERARKEFGEAKQIKGHCENNGFFMVRGTPKAQGWDWWFITDR